MLESEFPAGIHPKVPPKFHPRFQKDIWIKAGLAWTGQHWIQPQLGGRQLVSRELDEIPQEALRQKKMMSHSAWLAYLALHRTLQSCDWSTGREEIACFLGVGASGSEETELNRIVGASLDSRGEFSIRQFGSAGLAACNPLFAFQLMNNFTLCHGSILEKLGGPNAAFYSRGVGTVVALAEACFSLDENQTDRALAGGADTSLHPVTYIELLRSGRIAGGLKPAEGAAYLAVTTQAPSNSDNNFRIEQLGFYGGGGRGDLAQWLDEALSAMQVRPSDALFGMPWGTEVRAKFNQEIRFTRLTRLKCYEDLSETLGESLAASPAVAWVEALRRMVERGDRRGIVLSAGIDGGLGAVVFSRERGSEN